MKRSRVGDFGSDSLEAFRAEYGPGVEASKTMTPDAMFEITLLGKYLIFQIDC